jgi:hypothetical protein
MRATPLGWVGALSLVPVVPLFLAAGAEARKYTVSGPTRALVYDVGGGLASVPALNPPGAAGTANQTGSAPATLTLPPGVFDQDGPIPFTFPLPFYPQPSIQFASSAYVQAAPTATAMFRAGHWMATRPHAAFSFCPGAAANPGCTTGATTGGPTQGIRRGRVRYTPGANQFGGTMTTILGGTQSVSIRSLVDSEVRRRHVPLNLNVINGRPYGVVSTGTGAPAEITTGGMFSSGGIITQPGDVVGTSPGVHRTSTGFPFTTGRVVITIPNHPPTSPPSSFTGTGSDNRTPLGAGNISMVAGGLGRLTLDPEFATLETIHLTLIPQVAVPSLNRLGRVLLGTLLLVSAAFVASRARSRAIPTSATPARGRPPGRVKR